MTPELVRELFDYDLETGELRWRAGRKYRTSRSAGCHSTNGYLVVRTRGRYYLAHRLIWAWVTGAWPDRNIDHRNQVRDDNRWSNLRLATIAQNGQNHRLPGRNTSGVCGVSFNSRHQRWKVDICANGVKRFLGYFDDFEEAASVRRDAELAMFGEFAIAA